MPNKKQATKKSQYEAKVKHLDALGTDIKEFIQQESMSKVEEILGRFIERIHTNIDNEKDMVTTGSINDITLQAEGNKINVIGTKHLLFQDRGVNGAVKKKYNTPHAYTDKMPPVQVFVDWIKRKNINLVNNHKYKGDGSPFEHMTEDERINSAAWGMAKKVYKEGFKPRKIYSKEIPKLIKDLKKEITDFTIQAITQVIDVKPSAQRTIIKK